MQAFFGDVVATGCIAVVVVADDLTPVAIQPILQLHDELRHGPARCREGRAKLHAVGQPIRWGA